MPRKITVDFHPLAPRCARPLGRGRGRCARPAKHRGACSLQSSDLAAARGTLRAPRPRVNWQAQLESLGIEIGKSREHEFCELAADIGLARAAELLKRTRSVTVEFANELGADRA